MEKRPVPLFTIYFLTLAACLPLSASLCLSLIDCLFIHVPAAASAPEDEIVMVIVIFCGGDKKGEGHKEEIGFATYMEDRIKIW